METKKQGGKMRQSDRVEVDPRRFRETLGRFASGITVVTTVHEGEVYGMTANAFVSVSLDPPLVLISVDNRANMHEILPKSKRYGVSILAEEQQALSQHFAGQPQEGLEVPFVQRNEVPLLAGAVAHLVCRVVDEYPAGDHTLYIGQVEYLDYRDGVPLLFYTGTYQNLEVQIRETPYWW
jgi:flavin reductase (DIM6/NTAB) family NADH-FMN oxidoreductase RutF